MVVTKEIIKAEIEKIPTERLNELYEVIKEFSVTKSHDSEESFMAKMRRIKIDAPPDFSRHIDSYLNGEKTID